MAEGQGGAQVRAFVPRLLACFPFVHLPTLCSSLGPLFSCFHSCLRLSLRCNLGWVVCVIAFSWKQKRILGLDVEKKKRLSNKIDEIGPMESLEGIYGEEFGDFMVDLKDPNMTQEKLELIMPQSFNRLKKVEISRLFGSNKPCGQLENKW